MRRRPLLAACIALAAGGALFAGAMAGAGALDANEPALAQQWGMTMIGAPTAWHAGATGRGSTIAVIDTGTDLTHEDLAANVVAPGVNLLTPGSPAQDDEGHGTHVSGIAAAVTGNGIGVTGTAPDAKILPFKVLDSTGKGDTSAVDDAIRKAADAHATVINLSLGPDISLPIFDPTGFTDAVNYAWSKGSVVVVAAGNSSIPTTTYATMDAIVVTAVDRTGEAASYANGVGPAQWGLAAPGGYGANPPKADDNILSTLWVKGKANSYGYDAGTSMATPYVAGAAAVLRSLGLTPQQTVDRLLATATDLGASGRDTFYGSGRLNLAKAVEGLTPTGAATTTPTTPATTAPATTVTAGPTRTTTRPGAAAPTTAPPTGGTALASPPGTDAATTTTAPPAELTVDDGLRPPDDPVHAAAVPSTAGSRGHPGRSGSEWALGAVALGLLLGAGGWAWRLRGFARHG